jgi:hypothetical protein
MDTLTIKYSPYVKAMPPQAIQTTPAGWSGEGQIREDGTTVKPWHALPFALGSTYGLEVVYPYETECHVIGADGTVRFEWDFTQEPGGVLTGGEFRAFSPVDASKYYLFNTRLDLRTPPGYVLRTEPHPRYFTDDTGTVPLAMIAHLQNEWYPRLVFVVFRAPRQGQQHIFRKGEPFVQLLCVPQRVKYDLHARGREGRTSLAETK